MASNTKIVSNGMCSVKLTTNTVMAFMLLIVCVFAHHVQSAATTATDNTMGSDDTIGKGSHLDRDDAPYYPQEMRPDLMDLIRAGYFQRAPIALRNGGPVNHPGYQLRARRKFPEVDSKGFDSDIFDEGFGDFSTMRKRSLLFN